MWWYGLNLNWAYAELLPNISRRTQSRQLSYDVLHDALLRFALTKNPERIEQPQAYLRTIIRNILADDYRESVRFVPFIMDSQDEDEAHFSPTECVLDEQHSPSPEHLADLHQRMEALQRIIDLLPPKCREVFWQYRVEGIGQAEIATKLGISLNMVERHLIRALVDIRLAKDLVAA